MHNNILKLLNKEELRQIFSDAGFLYPTKLANLDLELALDNIMASYKTPDHKYIIKRDKSDRVVGHLGMLQIRPKVWMGHHHCALKFGMGQDLFLEFANWVWENQDEIEILLAYYHVKNAKLYRGLMQAVDNSKQCWEEKVGLIQKEYVKDKKYGLNLSQLHYEDFNIPPLSTSKRVYYRWTFLCNEYTLSKSIEYFIGDKNDSSRQNS